MSGNLLILGAVEIFFGTIAPSRKISHFSYVHFLGLLISTVQLNHTFKTAKILVNELKPNKRPGFLALHLAGWNEFHFLLINTKCVYFSFLADGCYTKKLVIARKKMIFSTQGLPLLLVRLWYGCRSFICLMLVTSLIIGLSVFVLVTTGLASSDHGTAM